MDPIRNFVKRVKWISISLFLLGIIFILVAVVAPQIHSSEILHAIFKEIGVALMIASIVGIIIETTEITSFVEERLVSIVSKDDFLRSMETDRLNELLNSTIKTLGEKKANNPSYYHDRLPGIVSDEILSNIGETSLLNYNETIDYCYGCDSDLAAVNVDITKLKRKCVRLRIKTRYNVVAPMIGVETEHEIVYNWEVKKIPGLDKLKHFSVDLMIDGEKQDIDVEKYVKETEAKVELDLKYPHKFTDEMFVYFEVTIFEYGASGNYWSFTYNYIENVSVHFSSDKALDISGDIYGIAGHFYPVSVTSHSISMVNPGLLMPGHGYFIVWQEID